MKRCSYCGVEYPDDAAQCSVDQSELLEDSPARAPSEPPPDAAARFEIAPMTEADKLKDFVTILILDDPQLAKIVYDRLRVSQVQVRAFKPGRGLGGGYYIQVAPKDYDDAKNLLVPFVS